MTESDTIRQGLDSLLDIVGYDELTTLWGISYYEGEKPLDYYVKLNEHILDLIKTIQQQYTEGKSSSYSSHDIEQEQKQHFINSIKSFDGAVLDRFIQENNPLIHISTSKQDEKEDEKQEKEEEKKGIIKEEYILNEFLDKIQLTNPQQYKNALLQLDTAVKEHIYNSTDLHNPFIKNLSIRTIGGTKRKRSMCKRSTRKNKNKNTKKMNKTMTGGTFQSMRDWLRKRRNRRIAMQRERAERTEARARLGTRTGLLGMVTRLLHRRSIPEQTNDDSMSGIDDNDIDLFYEFTSSHDVPCETNDDNFQPLTFDQRGWGVELRKGRRELDAVQYCRDNTGNLITRLVCKSNDTIKIIGSPAPNLQTSPINQWRGRYNNANFTNPYEILVNKFLEGYEDEIVIVLESEPFFKVTNKTLHLYDGLEKKNVQNIGCEDMTTHSAEKYRYFIEKLQENRAKKCIMLIHCLCGAGRTSSMVMCSKLFFLIDNIVPPHHREKFNSRIILDIPSLFSLFPSSDAVFPSTLHMSAAGKWLLENYRSGISSASAPGEEFLNITGNTLLKRMRNSALFYDRVTNMSHALAKYFHIPIFIAIHFEPRTYKITLQYKSSVIRQGGATPPPPPPPAHATELAAAQQPPQPPHATELAVAQQPQYYVLGIRPQTALQDQHFNNITYTGKTLTQDQIQDGSIYI